MVHLILYILEGFFETARRIFQDFFEILDSFQWFGKTRLLN